MRESRCSSAGHVLATPHYFLMLMKLLTDTFIDA